MKKIILAVLVLFTAMAGRAQTDKQQSAQAEKTEGKPVHKIVFQLTTEDTLAHKSLMRQLNNITTIAPGTKIEVVCHGPGLSMLITGKTTVQDKMQQLVTRGVEFVACEFSMSEKNIPKEKIVPEAGFVKAGIIEIVTRQEAGWSYIKSGF